MRLGAVRSQNRPLLKVSTVEEDSSFWRRQYHSATTKNSSSVGIDLRRQPMYAVDDRDRKVT